MSNERSICDADYLPSIQAKVNVSIMRSKLRQAEIWYDRFQKRRDGSYEQRKRAISDYLRFLAFFDRPFRRIFDDDWVKTTIQQAVNEADVTFFKRFGEMLENPVGKKNLDRLDRLDIFLWSHWAEAHGGLPELCALHKSGLARVIDCEPTLRPLKGTIGADTLAHRCSRHIKLPAYPGKKMRVRGEKANEILTFVKTDGTTFIYPDASYSLERFLKAHWNNAYGGLPELRALTKAGLKLVVHYAPVLNYLRGIDVDKLTQRCCGRLKLPDYRGEMIRAEEDAEKERVIFTRPDGKSFFYPDPTHYPYWDDGTGFHFLADAKKQAQEAVNASKSSSEKVRLWAEFLIYSFSRTSATKRTP